MTDYIKIGRINMTRAREAHIKSADIYINKKHLVHIGNVHKKELSQLGISPINYVTFIVENYNQIRSGDGSSLLLIVASEHINHVAAIDINYSLKDDFWEAKTAQPRKTKEIDKKKLLWRNCPSS